MTQAQTIDERIREFILRQFPLTRRNGFKAEEKWIETGLLDSLGVLDLVHFLELEFSIKIADEELLPENFQSLAAVADFVRRKK